MSLGRTESPSRSAVRKAGSTIRAQSRRRAHGETVPESEVQATLHVVSQYRQSFSGPLRSMNMSLRSYLKSLGLRGEVSQRLKRMTTIVDKLSVREQGLDLSRMRDIGGCRVVVDGPETDLYVLAQRIEANNSGTRLIDYVKQPRRSGYSALHLEVPRNNRVIEVQLRTTGMHRWAENAEALGNAMGENFKWDGDTLAHQLLALLAEVRRSAEHEVPMTDEQKARLALLYRSVTDLLNKPTEAGER